METANTTAASRLHSTIETFEVGKRFSEDGDSPGELAKNGIATRQLRFTEHVMHMRLRAHLQGFRLLSSSSQLGPARCDTPTPSYL